MAGTPALAGRDDLVAAIHRDLRRGRHVLLTGPSGIGKTAMLQAIAAELQARGARVLQVAQASPAKPMLVEMAQQLHAVQALPYADIPQRGRQANRELAQEPWTALHSVLNRLPIRELAQLLLTAVRQARQAGQPFLLCLDSLEGVTPTQQATLVALSEQVQILGATINKKTSGNLAKLWWRFQTYALPPLDEATCRALVADFLTTRPVLCAQPRMFIKHAVAAAGGNPQALTDLLAHAASEGTITEDYIRSALQHEAGPQYFDLTPLVILGLCVLVASRFVARGMHESDMYLLASVGTALSLFVRFFLGRTSRPAS